ncbi:MAG: hypothetical protein N4A40_04025, partial [Tissierellales bacterium]|nr:hypothetical protein [Tissierellales bacterium]
MKKYFIRKTMIGAITATMLVGGLATSVSAAKPVEDMEEAVQEIDFAKTSFKDVVEKLAGDKASEIDEDDMEELKEIYDEFFDSEDKDDRFDVKEEFAEELEDIVYKSNKIKYSPVDEMNEELRDARSYNPDMINTNEYKNTQKLINRFEKLYKEQDELEEDDKELSDEKLEELNELEDKIYDRIELLGADKEFVLRKFKNDIDNIVKINGEIKTDKAYKSAVNNYKKIEDLIKNNDDLSDKECDEYDKLVKNLEENIDDLSRYTKIQEFLIEIKEDILDDYPKAKKTSEYKKIKKLLKEVEELAQKEKKGTIDENDIEEFDELEDDIEDLIDE